MECSAVNYDSFETRSAAYVSHLAFELMVFDLQPFSYGQSFNPLLFVLIMFFLVSLPFSESCLQYPMPKKSHGFGKN